jgi:hypothetical protein
MRIKQKILWAEGVGRKVCPVCNEVITYPDGVYFRNGIEVHTRCVAVARMRRGSIAGIDYNI